MKNMPLQLRAALGISAAVLFLTQVMKLLDMRWLLLIAMGYGKLADIPVAIMVLVVLKAGTLYMLTKRRRWARNAMVVWWLVVFVNYWAGLYTYGIESDWLNIYACVMLIAETCAVALLFTKDCTAWFSQPAPIPALQDRPE